MEESYVPSEQNTMPSKQLDTTRGLLKFTLLSLITLGIYGIVVLSHISTEINYIASKHDHRHTMHFCLIYFLFSWISVGIVSLIWWNNISGRIGEELKYRNLPYEFSSGTFWGWYILGSFIIVGPFIYVHKLMKAMNILCEDYNQKG